MEATFKINGIEFIDYIIQDGIDWSVDDLDGENAGRTLDGVMHRDYIDNKVNLTLKIKKLTFDDSQKLIQALRQKGPDGADITYVDQELGVVTKNFYFNKIGSTTHKYAEVVENGVKKIVPIYINTTFNLHEN